MAWTGVKVPLPELVEAAEDLDQKARQLADMIRASKHFIVFTGAGVSTSAGIPDFRGPDGAWTLQAQGRQRTTAAVSSLQAIPTATHMALVALQDQGVLKYLVSQNCDGLHRRSGILPVRFPEAPVWYSPLTAVAEQDKISELHGNNNLEVCKDCGKEYLRDFRAVADNTKSLHDHRTGRKCAVCAGPLHDTIIHFTENLPQDALTLAREHARSADLCLVLGSSLTVTPANEIPAAVVAGSKRKRGGRRQVQGQGQGQEGDGGRKLVICNLQATPLDGEAALRVHARTDDLMVRVMRELGVEVPRFVLRRRLVVTVEQTQQQQRVRVGVAGVDVDGTPASFLRTVKMVNNRRVLKAEPFVFDLRAGGEGEGLEGFELRLELGFMGHYGEPDLELVHHTREGEEGAAVVYLLEYDPSDGEWTTTRQ